MTNFLDYLEGFTKFDLIAIIWFMVAWAAHVLFGRGVFKEHKTLFSVVKEQRMVWMQRMMQKDNRITDITALGNLMRSIAFFASTSILIALGMATMLTYQEAAVDILANIPFVPTTTDLMWEIKIAMLTLIFIYAFFKFTWSLRTYNYVCIFVCGLPLPTEETETHESLTLKGCLLMNNAGRHFTLGIRTYYFGVAAFCWIIHPIAFILATFAVLIVIYRQEFRSPCILDVIGLIIPLHRHLDRA